jgi:hypothetical protein
MGWPDHPIFGQGVASHPIPAVWAWPKPPQAFGGGPATPKGQKKKTKKMGFGFWGWPDHPLGPGGGFRHHLPVVGGGRSHPQALGGGPATPKIPNPFFLFFVSLFFFFGLSGWSDHPQRPGVASATPIRPVWGGRPPRFLRSFLFFYYFIIYYF